MLKIDKIDLLKEFARRDEAEGVKPTAQVNGTQWTVDVFGNYVKKTPRDPSVNTAGELFGRHQEAIALMNSQYYNQKGKKPPVPGMSMLSDECMIQERVCGRRLNDLSDEEIASLPSDSLLDLYHLLNCALAVKNPKGILTDFVDLPGYNFDIPSWKRTWKAMQARYSINIMVGDDGKIFFVDPDMYYASTRNAGTLVGAAVMKPVMMLFTKMFRDEILQILNDRRKNS